MGIKNRQRGKANEHAVTKILKGWRIAILGGADILVDNTYYLECKEREEYPRWLQTMLDQAKSNCPENKIWVIQLHKLGTNHLGEDLVVIPLHHFAKLIKEKSPC